MKKLKNPELAELVLYFGLNIKFFFFFSLVVFHFCPTLTGPPCGVLEIHPNIVYLLLSYECLIMNMYIIKSICFQHVYCLYTVKLFIVMHYSSELSRIIRNSELSSCLYAPKCWNSTDCYIFSSVFLWDSVLKGVFQDFKLVSGQKPHKIEFPFMSSILI